MVIDIIQMHNLGNSVWHIAEKMKMSVEQVCDILEEVGGS